MRVKQLRPVVLLLAGAALVSGATVSEQAIAQEPPTRVILIIGDGAGVSYWTAAAFATEVSGDRIGRYKGLRQQDHG